MAKVKTLRTHPLFSSLTDRELAFFSRIVHEGDLPAGTNLLVEGKESAAFYLVQKGKVGVAGSAVPGHGATLGEGEVLGLWSLIAPPHPSAVTARTLEECSLLVVKRSDFEAFAAQEPAVGLKVHKAFLSSAWEDLLWARERAFPKG